ncbi:catalase family peroxidase [Alteromonas sp. SM 2104]|nr:catalase family peroxidase [Alteromonas oceanisediminis]
MINPAMAQDPLAKPQATDFIELFEKLSGKHAGFRKAHARGVCATGTFSPEVSEAFRGAPLLNSGELPVTLRFSLGGGNPHSDERIAGARGVGLQIKLPDGRIHNFTGNNFPVFAGKDPATFFGFLSTLLPDDNGQRDPAKTGAFIQQHPSVQAHVAWQASAKPAASYANTEFFGIHTFYYDKTNAQRTKFRWQLTPTLPVEILDETQLEGKPADFLADRLTAQLSEGDVSFVLQAVVGEPQDPDIDPSIQWPKDRPRVALGKITLQDAGDEACVPINFDPNVMSAGFKASADPVLQMRSPAYAVSFAKRLSNQ